MQSNNDRCVAQILVNYFTLLLSPRDRELFLERQGLLLQETEDALVIEHKALQAACEGEEEGQEEGQEERYNGRRKKGEVEVDCTEGVEARRHKC
jgi:hypothetical protein